MDYTGDGCASAAGFKQLFGRDGEFDQRVKTSEGGEVEDGLRLLLTQNQGGGVRLSQSLEPMLEHEPLAEIQRGPDIRKTRRFEKEFLTGAGEEFSLRRDSRAGAVAL
ncbi:MAG TPA: hypothetical protein VNF28_01075 [Candidatus Binataceae bacterium]|nr:hypothetical protein [Candidatus Binataceae bacterium]